MSDVATQSAVDPAETRGKTIRPARAVCRLTIAINGMDYRVIPNRAAESAAMKAYG